MASIASHSSLDHRPVTRILVELKTLSTSALITGIGSMVYARVARQGHSSDWLIYY